MRIPLDGRRLPWLLAALLALFIAHQQFSRHVVDPIDGVSILRLLWEFDSAAEAKDAVRLSTLFDTEAEHFGLTTGRLVRGREAIRQLFEEEFSGEAGADRVDTEIVSFRFVTPNVLLGDLTASYTNYRLGDRLWPVFREHTMAILVKRDHAWLVSATSAGGHDASR